MTSQTNDKYFLYEPEGFGPEFFATKEERDQVAAKCILDYKDQDGWNEDVEHIVVGEVTGKATAVNITRPAGEINEDGYDENEEHWEEGCTEKCNFKIMPIDYNEALPNISPAHPGCKFYKCTTHFKTDDGVSVKSSSPADENGLKMAKMMMEVLVYAHGYEGALEIAKNAADEYKHTWS